VLVRSRKYPSQRTPNGLEFGHQCCITSLRSPHSPRLPHALSIGCGCASFGRLLNRQQVLGWGRGLFGPIYTSIYSHNSTCLNEASIAFLVLSCCFLLIATLSKSAYLLYP